MIFFRLKSVANGLSTTLLLYPAKISCGAFGLLILTTKPVSHFSYVKIREICVFLITALLSFIVFVMQGRSLAFNQADCPADTIDRAVYSIKLFIYTYYAHQGGMKFIIPLTAYNCNHTLQFSCHCDP